MLNIKKLLTKILTDKFDKSGGELTGNINQNVYSPMGVLAQKTTRWDSSVGVDVPSSGLNNMGGGFARYDKNGTQTFYSETHKDTNDNIYTSFVTRRIINGNAVLHGHYTYIKKDGTPTVSFPSTASKEAWKTGLDYYAVTSYTHTDFGYTSNTQAYATSGSNQPRAYKHGRVVTLTGCIKNTSEIAATTDAVQIGSVPSDCKPISPYRAVVQGSGMNRFLLTIETDGRIQLARYGTTSFINVAAGSWLNIGCTYISAS